MNPLHGFVEKNCNVFTIRILAVHGKTSTIGCCCLINRVWFGILIHRKICTTIPLVFLPGSKCHWKPGPSNSKSNIETSLESSYHLSQLLPARWPGTSLKSGAIAVLVSGLVSIAFFCLPKKALMCHKLKPCKKSLQKRIPDFETVPKSLNTWAMNHSVFSTQGDFSETSTNIGSCVDNVSDVACVQSFFITSHLQKGRSMKHTMSHRIHVWYIYLHLP